jgi:lipoic acid synthetase
MEPLNVAKAVDRLGLDFVVITSVSRDDLPDGGASHFASTIELIRGHRPQARVEVLIPDFSGSRKALETVLGARPDVLNHNLETVRRLYPRVRPGASYERSLDVFRRAGQMAPGVVLKSGLMLGLGEHEDEILQALEDLLEAGCDVITLGQYLQPTPRHLPVARFVHPDEFDRWRSSALELGFKGAACGPFVRSSYHAHRLWAEASALSP